MTSSTSLRERIEAFDIDGGGTPALPFAARLARENQWAPAYAARVVREYKRFVVLAMTHGRPVCPSEDVDEAWHLHLTYTRSYWQRFCRDTLGTELHHDPTRGGPAEHAKHVAMYEETLAAYEAMFGEPAPADIWPPAQARFAVRAPLGARIAALGRRAAASLLALPVLAGASKVASASTVGTSAGVASAVVLAGAAAWYNPFALTGLEFFNVAIPALVIAIFLGRMINVRLRNLGTDRARAGTPLDWQQAAYLAGGVPRLATATIAKLIADGSLKITGFNLEKSGNRPDRPTPVETAVRESMPIDRSSSESTAAYQGLNKRVAAAYAPEIARLAARGLVVAPEQRRRAFRLALLPLAAVFLGLLVPRLVMGLNAGRPVGYLLPVMLLGAVFGPIVILASRQRDVTTAGRETLAVLTQQQQARRPSMGGVAAGAAVGLAVGLLGTAALAGTGIKPLEELEAFLPKSVAGSSSSGCSTGCSSGGDGGGGGGCSGCGGGGGGGD